MRNYEIYGELPDEDKKLLFTSQQHLDDNCFKCCDECRIDCCFCTYVCCDQILFQMDYKRNNKNFYTQGIYLKKGCYWCELNCYCCGRRGTLYLRENTDPDRIDNGIDKGKTLGTPDCCKGFRDKKVTYYIQDDCKGPKIKYKLTLCDICNNSCYHCCCCCVNDIIIDIMDEKDQIVGNILVPNGCNSQKVDKTCYYPGAYYEINLPPNSSSIEKFQIIADVIHFDLENRLL